MISRGTFRRLAAMLALGAGVLVTYPAVSGGVLWDLGAACGYICLTLIVCLYAFPVRGDGLPHARLLGLSQHKSVGWCVLGVAIAHVAVVLLAEPLSARYLLPSAPLFMWCGIAALVVLVALVITGLSARAQMRRSAVAGPGAVRAKSAGASRATLHVVLAAALVLTASAHIVGSSQLLSGVFKPVVVLLLLALPPGWYALRRRLPRSGSPAPGARRSLVRTASHLATVAVVALMPAPVSKQLLLEPVLRPGPIAVSFPHDSHTSVSCVVCHHNYVDHTGTTTCVECHRSARADLVHSSESTFHTFCRDCHTQLALDSVKHGPTRSCSACHQGIRSNNL